jgi:murein DD-endopeptidase MepM/ murein hydrolase activator NlpD
MTAAGSSASARVVGRGTLVALALLVALAAGVKLATPYWEPYLDLALAPTPERLPIPVAGIRAAALVDTWGAERSGGRRHKGIDIFARRGTAVMSPVLGVVVDVGQDRLGGNVVRILGPGRQVHYFAHLDRFGPIRERQWIRPGDVIGFVGDTGNARGTPPHLHYGLYAAGGAINPFPLLRPAESSVTRRPAASGIMKPPG